MIDHECLTYQDLMRSSRDIVGIEGSPFVLPVWSRRMVARLVSYHPALFGLVVWLLYQAWGRVGLLLFSNPLVREWSQNASGLSLKESMHIARTVADLDRHPTFRRGARRLGARNCLEYVFLYSGFTDFFYAQAPLARTEISDPHQRPYFLVPGIPARRYYPAAEFEWAAILEHSYPMIRQELLALLQRQTGFGTYQDPNSLAVAGWNTFPLWLYGKRHEENAALCPGTVALLESLSGFESGEWILFSALNGDTRIPPHTGPITGILRGHLALLVPDGCRLRVGGQDSTWQEGKVLVFDDSFVHEVWNQSDRVRVVLFLNFWHPCLSLAEREALTKLRKAYQDTPNGKGWLEKQERPLPSSLVV